MAATTSRRATPAPPADPSARIIRFGERYVRHLKGEFAGTMFRPERWQRDDIIRPLFGTLQRQRNGRYLRQYREALIGIPRKNGKSKLAELFALYGLFADGEPGAEIYSLAGSKPQARIVFDGAKTVVLADPYLRAAAKVYKDAIEVPETGSVYRVLSADARLAHGYNPHMAIVDEYHVHRTADLYEAMRSGTAARRQPLIVTITTAGYDPSSPLAKFHARAEAGDDPRLFYRWYAAPADSKLMDTKTWRAANPASWVRIAYLRDQARALPENVFRRLHLNQWTSSDAVWIPTDVWDANDDKPSIDPDLPSVVAVDSAPKRDSTAIVLLQRDDDGVHHAVTWIFEADRQMGILDYVVVEDMIRTICSEFRVDRIAVDPYTMIRSMMMLAAEGLPVEDFPQNDSRMVPASQNLYDLAQTGRIRHGGDPELRAHALGAKVLETSRGWRIHKLKSGRPIDALTALAMAAYLAEQEAGTYSPPNAAVV